MSSPICRLAIFFVYCVCATACAREPYTLVKLAPDPVYQATTPNFELIDANYKAVDLLVSRVRPSLPPEAPMIVATIVNINALENSSTLGRVISEHVLGRLAQSGYGVIELKIRDQIYMKRHEGEFLLTREIRDLARSHHAKALVVGTYAEASDRVFISIKVIEVDGSRIIGAVDYAIEKDGVIRSLLAKNGL
jgi:TolB-like protein